MTPTRRWVILAGAAIAVVILGVFVFSGRGLQPLQPLSLKEWSRAQAKGASRSAM
jgi:hypothetical protein